MDVNGQVTKVTWRIENFSSSATLPSGWSRYAHFGLAVIDQFHLTMKEITWSVTSWGFPSFLPLSELHNPTRGYLVNDTCLVEAYVFTDRKIGFISHELIVKTDADKLKTKEADCVKAAMDNQKTATEPEEPTEEDMNTFFTSL
ncbi:hypothetical protein Golax_000062, partial [Gossypium laxum]|nr:hypothetical protein [Gossypium laxum]